MSAPRPRARRRGRSARSARPSLARPGRLLGVTLFALLAVAVGPAPVAQADEPPTIAITSPAAGSTSNDQTPSFSGQTSYVAENEFVLEHVLVKIYAGTSLSGAPVQTLSAELPFGDPKWAVGPAESLPAGVYTAQAEVEPASAPVTSPPVSFTVDTTPPQVSLTSPGSGSSSSSSSQVVAGSAGTAPGDVDFITTQLWAGASIGSQAPLEALTVPASGGRWTTTFGGLSPGTYTVRAEQRDEAGNVGLSAPASFTVTTPSFSPPIPPAPPQAAFSWFPTTPTVGETVSLISSSTDEASPIAGFAWSLLAGGPFQAAGPVLSTSFATPGDHAVALRVSAADGLSSVATQTIHVVAPTPLLINPFPIVRIAGNVTASGVRLSLITAQVPVGARVQVSCRGRGCPRAPVSRLATVGVGSRHRPSQIVLAFPRFERPLGVGVVLEVRISEAGRIGKYTRFSILRGTLPQRLDSCLSPAGVRPMSCPS